MTWVDRWRQIDAEEAYRDPRNRDEIDEYLEEHPEEDIRDLMWPPRGGRR